MKAANVSWISDYIPDSAFNIQTRDEMWEIAFAQCKRQSITSSNNIQSNQHSLAKQSTWLSLIHHHSNLFFYLCTRCTVATLESISNSNFQSLTSCYPKGRGSMFMQSQFKHSQQQLGSLVPQLLTTEGSTSGSKAIHIPQYTLMTLELVAWVAE